MKRIYLILITIIATISACKKQDMEPEKTNSVLSRIRYYFVDKTYFEAIYNYSPNGLLANIAFRDSIGGTASKDLQFYTGTRLDSSVSVDKNDKAFTKNIYSYQGNKLTGTANYQLNQVNNKLEIYYNRTITYNGNILYKTSDVNAYSDHNTYTVYTYTNGNVSDIKIYRSADNELLENTIYEYDTKLNPYYNKPYTNRYNIINNKNNVTLERMVYAKNRQPGEVRYQYTYNSQGYPLMQYIKGTGTKLIAEQEFFYNK